MRNWGSAFALGLLAPLGVLLATSRPHAITSTPPTGSNPSVQSVVPASQTNDDPLVAPIIASDLSNSRSLSLAIDFTHGDRAVFQPHGEQVCASGCAASRHPTDKLTRDRFNDLLLEYANQPIADGLAQDELLYYGRQTVQLLATEGRGPLDPVRAAVLEYELTRDHVEIEMRVVDALDHVRASLPPTNVPLDRRHEFDLDTHNLQPMIASGTVKRVGRDYLWTRL